jgi:hypothetical protein
MLMTVVEGRPKRSDSTVSLVTFSGVRLATEHDFMLRYDNGSPFARLAECAGSNPTLSTIYGKSIAVVS